MKTLVLFFAILLAGAAHGQQTLSAQATMSEGPIYEGSPFRYQIQVSGSDRPEAPDMSAFTDFTVNLLGGAPNSMDSLTTINGRTTRHRQVGFVFTYELTPKKEGILSIPAVKIRADGGNAETQPLTVTVRKPEETEDFKLRVTFSKGKAYVGEPVSVEIIFYYGAQMEEPQLSFPMLNDDRFFFYDLDAKNDGAIGELEGKTFRTLRIRKAFIPKEAGSYSIQPATVQFLGLAGYSTRRDVFGRAVRQGQFQSQVVPSNGLTLEVLDLPVEGRPPHFAGHVGEYNIHTFATPTEAGVGDPITLTVSVSGPPYLAHVELPPLSQQAALTRDFKVPAEIASGSMKGAAKVFTQTIRALRDDITGIPPVELPYFDTAAGAYKIAKSDPIPIKIRTARVVTALDAEGSDPIQGPGSSEVQSWTEGIAHNYEDAGVLLAQTYDPGLWFRSPSFWLLLSLPAGYLALQIYRRRQRLREADPAGALSRQALGEFQAELERAASAGAILEALRTYLGHKLRLPAKALTWRDLEKPLADLQVEPATLESVKTIFAQGEASRYSGLSTADVAELRRRALEAALDVESRVKSNAPLLLQRFAFLQKFLGLILLCLPFTAQALTQSELATEFQEGNRLFREANDISAADPGKARELYEKAVLRFERLAREGGVRNGKIYYNLGNAYFRLQDLGRAILNYRRAELFTPNDPNLLHNLAYARLRRADRIEEAAGDRLLRSVFFWHYDFSSRARTAIFTLAFVMVWICLAARLWIARPYLKWTAGFAGALALVMLISLIAEAGSLRRTRPGVVLAPEVIARKGDSETYERSFETPLHAGAEFTLVEDRGDWLHVALADGRRCWLPRTAVEMVR